MVRNSKGPGWGLILLVVATVLIGSLLAYAQQQVNLRSFYNGNEYRTSRGIEQLAYVAGALDAFFLHAAIVTARPETDPSRRVQECIQNRFQNTTLGQIRSVVEKYLDSHPEEWNRSMAWVISRAILEFCP